MITLNYNNADAKVIGKDHGLNLEKEFSRSATSAIRTTNIPACLIPLRKSAGANCPGRQNAYLFDNSNRINLLLHHPLLPDRISE